MIEFVCPVTLTVSSERIILVLFLKSLLGKDDEIARDRDEDIAIERKLVIHIGLRKTGSSALQDLFYRETSLLRKHRIDYPEGLTEFPSHQELAWSLMVPEPSYYDIRSIGKSADEIYDYYCKLIDSNIRASRATLLSSEDLSLLSFDSLAMETIRRRFQSYDPLIVLFVRDPVSYLISDYKHALVTSRETRSFSEYVFDISRLIYAHSKAHYSIWAGYFSLDNIKVLNYEPDRFRNESIFSEFFKSVFVKNIEAKNFRSRVNAGVSDKYVEYILSLNRSELSDVEIQGSVQKLQNMGSETDLDIFLENNLDENLANILRVMFRSG